MTWKELSPRWRWALVLLTLYSLARFVYSVKTYNPILSPSLSGDFYASIQEAGHWREAGQFQLMASTNVPYPAFFYWWLFPLTRWPYPAVSALLYITQFPLFAWALALLVRTASPDSRLQPLGYWTAALMAVNFQPFLETLSQHKAEGLEFVLICLGFLAFKEGKQVKSGALLFVASALKYLPGILLLYFALRRHRRVLGGFLLAGGLCLALFALVFGMDAAWNLGVRQTLWVGFDRQAESNQMMANFEWQSLSQLVNRFFARPDQPLAEILRSSQAVFLSRPEAARNVGTALKFVLLLGFFAWLGGRRNPDGREEWPLILLELCMTLLLLPFLIQAFRLHYGILLLPAFICTGLLLLQRWGRAGRPEKVLFIAAFLLSGLSYPRLFQWWTVPFYGYCLLGVVIFLFRRRLQVELLQK